MMKKIRYILAVPLFLLLNNSFLSGQEESHDAVLLSLTKEYQLNEDGSIEYREQKKLKLLTHFAFHRLYGETFIVYNPDYEDLTINNAFTIMADGKKIITPDNAFNEVLPRFAANVPEFNHLREMVVTHTGLEVGAVINLDYTINSTGNYYPALMGDVVIPSSSPIEKMTINIRAPKNTTLHYKILNIRTAPEITEENNFMLYSWTFHHLPARSHEPFQPGYHTSLPRLVFSTAKDMYRMLDVLTQQDAFQYKTNKPITSAVEQVMTDCKDDLKMILKLQKMIVDDLNNNNIPFEISGFHTRTPVATWKSNGGTELEKTLLLTAVLRNAGVKASPVAMIPHLLFEKKIGSLDVIKGFLVQVNTRVHGLVYLSAIHKDEQNLKYSLEGTTLVLLDPNIESIKTYTHESEDNVILVKGSLIFNPDDLVAGEISVELMGSLNPYFTFLSDKDQVKRLFRPVIGSNNITNVLSTSFNDNKSAFTIEFKNISPIDTQENYIFMDLPFVNKGINSWHMTYLLSKRETPLEIPEPITESYQYTITLPEGVVLVTSPTNIKIKNEAGKLVIELSQSENVVTISKSISLPLKTYKPVQYDDFRLLINTWNNNKYTNLIYKKMP